MASMVTTVSVNSSPFSSLSFAVISLHCSSTLHGSSTRPLPSAQAETTWAYVFLPVSRVPRNGFCVDAHHSDLRQFPLNTAAIEIKRIPGSLPLEDRANQLSNLYMAVAWQSEHGGTDEDFRRYSVPHSSMIEISVTFVTHAMAVFGLSETHLPR
jgi:hypothetical protein